MFFYAGSLGDGPDQSSHAHANPGASSSDHVCTGKVRNTSQLSLAIVCFHLFSCCLTQDTLQKFKSSIRIVKRSDS